MAELSPLRRRMIEDMTFRNLSLATQRSYLHAVTKFSRFFDRSPDRLDLERSSDRSQKSARLRAPEVCTRLLLQPRVADSLCPCALAVRFVSASAANRRAWALVPWRKQASSNFSFGL
jgi:hypothetical protein